ncbi:MAG: LamG domain-containing protein, partial [Sedimentisphaerales bacterium]|nr:LamG domain-containing protein [Sedimentisphaerales bacterium]
VKSVRITAYSNWRDSPAHKKFGLSEVRFTYIPVWARNFSPVDGTTDADFDTILTWRRGREAITHNVYFDTNEVEVTNRNVTPVSVDVSSYSPELCLGKTYYWCVDEVNPDMTPSVWKSDIMSLSTQESILIDGFETGYGDTGDDAVYKTWQDGDILNDSSNGSLMGRSSPPYLQTINHSGGHSAPMEFHNVTKSYSEVIADTSKLLNGSDWSIGKPNTLEIWFRADSNDVNEPVTDQLYVELNGGSKVVYDGHAINIRRPVWSKFKVPLDSINLDNVRSITIGVEKIGSVGGQGTIYLDDIQLKNIVPVEPVDPGTDNLIAYYAMENNVLDSSGSGIDGTFIGDPTYVPGPFTSYGQALEFNADSNEVVDLGLADPFNFEGSFSIAFWANIQDWGTGWSHAMVATRGEDVGFSIRRGGDWIAGLQNKSGTGLSFTTRGIYLLDQNNSEDMIADEPIIGEWTHIVCVLDKENNVKSVYFDGELVRTSETEPDAALIESKTNASIGARANSDNSGFENFFDGMLDDVKVYDDALSAGEVKYLYEN